MHRVKQTSSIGAKVPIVSSYSLQHHSRFTINRTSHKSSTCVKETLTRVHLCIFTSWTCLLVAYNIVTWDCQIKRRIQISQVCRASWSCLSYCKFYPCYIKAWSTYQTRNRILIQPTTTWCTSKVHIMQVIALQHRNSVSVKKSWAIGRSGSYSILGLLKSYK